MAISIQGRSEGKSTTSRDPNPSSHEPEALEPVKHAAMKCPKESGVVQPGVSPFTRTHWARVDLSPATAGAYWLLHGVPDRLVW
jgi:hypothetical protein